MEPIQCPECGRSISDKYSFCPKCGKPLEAYLNSKAEEIQTASTNDTSAQVENPVNIHQTPAPKKSKKKIVVAVIAFLAVCVIAVAALGIVLVSSFFTPKLTVEDITISNWELTASTDIIDYYEGSITSEQKDPFIAIIGEYNGEENTPNAVYVEDGKGVIKTYEDPGEDPSSKYTAIGYIGGKSVTLSDIEVKYTDSDYYDWSYNESTNCDVLVDIDMNNSKTGLLVFDIINETNNETQENIIAAVINGKVEYNYYAQLPYEARGIEISIVPKLFCKSAAITQEDYVIEKAYTAEKNEGSYSNSYWGEETLAFADYADGFVLYTRELKEGGNKEARNTVINGLAFLHDGECTLTTYDPGDINETILMPKYEFNIIGYITWTPLE